MPILFSCPHCGTKTQVADQYAGQSGPCAACGKTVTIPYPNYGPGAGAAVAAGAAGAGAGITIALVIGGILFASVCVIGILVALLLPAVQAAREAARRMSCANNLKQISLAFHNYQDQHGCFPPAYIPDKDGKPMHSWRVLILPYIEEQALYSQYNFKEPWDSPNNLRVAEHMPKVFMCPSDSDSRNTDYMVITGQETVFDGAKGCKFSDIRDGTSNTILVVEARGASTRWTEPKDLDFQRLSFTINGPPGDIGSRHPGGVQVALCDGSVRFLSKTTPPQTLRSMATKSGAEAVNLP
jgi:prepilin-type processing-associated H-X9-DG protein